MNVSKPRNSKTYYVRFQFRNQNIFRQTHCTSKAEALKFGRELRKQMLLSVPVPKTTQKSSTLMELIMAYKTCSEASKEMTIEQNVTRFQRYLQIAGKGSLNLSRSIDLLTPELAYEFRRNAKALDINPATANSYIQAAQSLSSTYLHFAYQESGLHFNAEVLTNFNQGQRRFKLPPASYELPKPALINDTLHAWRTSLRSNDPAAYMAIWLAMSFGLRRSEVLAAQYDWLMMHDDRLVLSGDHIAKNGLSINAIPCITESDQWPAEIKDGSGLRTDATPMIQDPGCIARIGRWMTELGWKTRNKLHEFRAFGGSQVARSDGIYAASRWLRHASVNVTERHYAKYVGNMNITTKVRSI